MYNQINGDSNSVSCLSLFFKHKRKPIISKPIRSEGSDMKIMILYHLYQGPDALADLREYKTKSKSVSCIALLIFKHKCKHMKIEGGSR